MIANCPNMIASAKQVALGGAGMHLQVPHVLGCTGASLGAHHAAGCGALACHAAGGALLTHTIVPVVVLAAAGFLSYKVYNISKDVKLLQTKKTKNA